VISRPLWPQLAALLMLIIPVASSMAAEDRFSEELLAIQQSWDVVNYETPLDGRTSGFESLQARTHDLAVRYPARAEAKVWEGIVLSSLAGTKGGLGALSSAKKARDSLEAAIAMDPAVLNGSAYTTLGVLHYKVPGFPLGFGDKKKADQLLRQALARNPDGIDPNYFYSEFLFEQGKASGALAAARKAAAAPPRPGRPVGDKGRHAEVDALIAKIEGKLR
jgi:tetratricopeptide (TPR) repeat protein